MRRPRARQSTAPTASTLGANLRPMGRAMGHYGRQAARHSIRINDQYRLTFRWENGHVFEVCVEDYH